MFNDVLRTRGVIDGLDSFQDYVDTYIENALTPQPQGEENQINY